MKEAGGVKGGGGLKGEEVCERGRKCVKGGDKCVNSLSM